MTFAPHPIGADAFAPSSLLRAAAARARARATRPPRRVVRQRSRSYRTIWISDVHLGTPGCQAGWLLDFLRASTCERLYLVGDIVDGWQLAREPYWPDEHEEVLRRFHELARTGTRVVYVTGNHDEELRGISDASFGDVRCVDTHLHDTADGRRLLVLHGDRFDHVLNGARWLAELGDRAYALSIDLDARLNRALAALRGPELRVSATLKRWGKEAAGRINRWEASLLAEAARVGADGVVCGHVHAAELRELGGRLYLNDGDWVESCTALAERHDGRLELLAWREDGPHVLDAVEPLPAGAALELATA